MPGKRIPELIALSGAGSANNDDVVIFDADAGVTKRISRSQLAAGLVGDLPYTPSGSISATTIPTAIAELDTEKQPLDATLTALAGLATGANKLAYSTGTDTFAQADFTAFARTLLGNADAAAARTTLGAQPLDATLTALAGLATGADKLAYSTGTDTFAQADFTAFARTLMDDADAAAARTTLSTQPLDATLTALAALSTASGDYIEATGTDTFRLLKLFIASVSGTPTHVGQIAVVAGRAHIAIGTVGSGDWRLIDWRDDSIPVATAAALADITNAENTTLKYTGKLIWDSTNKRMLRAFDGAAGADWEVVDGSAQVTPV